jgi:hypothetical protein
MRIFKNKWFNRWAREERISDFTLAQMAVEIVAGKVEVDLGSFLFKKRIARTGTGKRSGYRTIVGYKRPNSERIIFLYGFAKNVKSNISEKEKMALSLIAEVFISATDRQISELLDEGSIKEVTYNE